MNGLSGRHPADAEVGHAEVNLPVRPPQDEDVGRFQVAVYDGRAESVGEADDTRQLARDLRGLNGRETAAGAVVLNDARQLAAGDVFVLQAGRLRTQVGVSQGDNAGVLALAHDLIEHRGLVPQQPVLRRRVEAELQCHRRHAVEMRVACLPDLAEAAGAE